MPPLVIAGAIAGAGALGGSALAGHAAGKAASTQAQAAEQAAQLQHQDAQAALDFQKHQYSTSLGLLEPYYATGTQSLGTLAQLLGLNPTAANLGLFPGQQGSGQQPAAPGAAGGFDGGGFDRPSFGGGRFRALQAEGAVGGGNQGGASFANRENNFGDRPIPLGGDLPANFHFRTGGAGANTPVSFNGSPAVATASGAGAPALPNGLDAGYLSRPFAETFQPPDALTEQNDPGFQARLKLGTDAVQNSAAARGSLLSGGTAADLTRYAQDYGSNEYQNVYNRSFNNYITRYNTFKQNQSDIYNRYASLAGLGQTTAGQLSNAGLSTGNSIANTLLTSGSQIGQQLNNAAAARASGYIGGANAYGGAVNGLGNLAALYQILHSSPGGSTPNYPTPDYGSISF